jgi:hypothetical protein
VSRQIVASTSSFALTHKTWAIRLLNAALSKLESANEEHVILTILLLATNEPGREAVRVERSLPLQPHMPQGNWMSVYGRIEIEHAHAKALIFLVHRKGGLESIRMPGLGATIAL